MEIMYGMVFVLWGCGREKSGSGLFCMELCLLCLMLCGT